MRRKQRYWLFLAAVFLAAVSCAKKPLIGPTPKKEIIDKEQRVVHDEVGTACLEYRFVAKDGTYCYVGGALWNAIPIGSVVGCVTWKEK